jgi:hypothetical protein
MAIQFFDSFVSRHTAGGIDESGMQFWNIIVVKVTGAYDDADDRRWIEREEIVASKTIRCDHEATAIEHGLNMANDVRAAS